MSTPTVKLEHELSTGVWTDLVADGDVLMREPIRWRRGIFGYGPLDIVAGVGPLEYALRNDAGNSGGLQGYYSPGNSNVRSGFGRGTKVRLHIDAGGGVSRYVWAGRLDDVSPTPGQYRSQETFCTGLDYMAVLEDLTELDLALQEGVRTDQGVDAVLAEASEAPANEDIDTGLTSPPFMFDDLGGRLVNANRVLYDIGLSEGLGFAYVRGNATDGETFRWENRHARSTNTTVAAAITESEMAGLAVPSSRDDAINDVETGVFPRDVGTSTEVLAQSVAEIEVPAGDTRNKFFEFRDPDQSVAYIGGKDVVTPVANTDYTANDTSGGGGTDVTSDIAIVATKLGSTVLLAITNNGSATAFVRGPGGADGLQVRGTALRRFRPIVQRAEDSTSISNNGRQGLTFDMPYQENPEVGLGLAQWIVSLWATVGAFPVRVQLRTEKTSVLQTALAVDLGDRVSVTETVSGLSAVECFVQGIEGEISTDGAVRISWVLTPADTTAFWIWDTASVFDVNAFSYV